MAAEVTRASKKPELRLPVATIVKFYTVKMWSLEKIAGCFNCSTPTIRQRLIKAGVIIRASNDTKRGAPSPHRHIIDVDEAVRLYSSQSNVSITQVARSLGCNASVVRRALTEAGVTIRSLSQVVAGKRNGADNPNWRSDLTPEERLTRRDMAAQAKWRARVYERDRFACLKCGDSSGGNLNAHHIESHDVNRAARWRLENGATLCEPCHLAFHKRFGFGGNTASQFKVFMATEVIGSKYIVKPTGDIYGPCP